MRERASLYRGLLLAFVVGGIYAGSLDGSFHYDDEHSIVRNAAVRDLANLGAFLADPAMFSADPDKAMYRPLLLATYAANYAVHGYDVRGWHLVNICLHLTAVLLLWRLAILLGAGRAAWWGALVFAVHPLASEPVNYISSRSELLVGALLLGVLVAHAQSLAGDRRWRWGAAVLLAGALLSKSTAIVAVPALVALDAMVLCRRTASGLRPADLAARHGVYWALAALYLLVISGNGFLGGSLSTPVRDLSTQLLTQAKAPAYYARLLAVPRPLSVEHAFSESTSLHAVVLAAAALLLSVTAVAVAAWRRHRVWVLGLVGAALVLSPTSLMPLNVLVNERRLYLVVAAAGFVLLSGGIARMRVWTALACVCLAALTVQRNAVWATPTELWESAVRSGSRSYRTYVNLGKAYQEEGRTEAARAAYEQALVIDDAHGDVYNNLAVLLHSAGRVAEAVPYYRAALERYPRMSEIHLNLAEAYRALGDVVLAQDTFRSALELDADNGGLWNNFGEFLMQSRDARNAEGAFRRAAALLPGRHEPRNNLGNALGLLGLHDEAVAAYRDALALDVQGPARALILANLGETYLQLEDWQAARETLEASLTEQETATALDYRGRLAFAVGDLEAAVAWFRRAQAAGGGARAGLGLGRALEAMGDTVAARAAYTEVVRHGEDGDRRVRVAMQRLRVLEGAEQ